MSDLFAALAPVATVLDRLGIPYYVGGSVASSRHGIARATMDVDLIAEFTDSHVAEFVRALEAEYYVDDPMIRSSIRERSCFNLIHQQTMYKIDVFLPKRRAHDARAMSRRRTVDLLPDLSLPVATAEDIILAKLEWFRLGDEVSERQWHDVLGMLRLQGESLDAGYLRESAGELGVEDLLDRARLDANLEGA